MSDWYRRQFGDTQSLAITFALGRDPHPRGPAERDVTWGSIELWAGGHCLTRSVSHGGSLQDSVTWNLLPVLQWALEVGIRLVNEDPYPRFSRGIDVQDGAAWFDATMSPPLLDPAAEARWFLRRSEWRHHHAIRRAAEDVALPNVVLRRIADRMEISWDNQSWSPPRADLRFVERRGRTLVPADLFAKVLREALRDVVRVVAEKVTSPVLTSLAMRAQSFAASPEDWRWLVHRPTAQIIREQMPELRARLDRHASENAEGIYVPHSMETSLLRLVRLESRPEIEAVLATSRRVPHHPMTETIRGLISPRTASSERPWDEGNEVAELVREKLGWGDSPLPDLQAWLAQNGCGVALEDLHLPGSIAVLAERTEDSRALVHVNPKSHSRARKEAGLATALGHVLMDVERVSVDGDWEHWPTSARARAFGVALMLPENGVRQMLSGSRVVRREDVRSVMTRYGAGPLATTHRLKNLGLISKDEQFQLAVEVGA